MLALYSASRVPLTTVRTAVSVAASGGNRLAIIASNWMSAAMLVSQCGAPDCCSTSSSSLSGCRKWPSSWTRRPTATRGVVRQVDALEERRQPDAHAVGRSRLGVLIERDVGPHEAGGVGRDHGQDLVGGGVEDRPRVGARRASWPASHLDAHAFQQLAEALGRGAVDGAQLREVGGRKGQVGRVASPRRAACSRWAAAVALPSPASTTSRWRRAPASGRAPRRPGRSPPRPARCAGRGRDRAAHPTGCRPAPPCSG